MMSIFKTEEIWKEYPLNLDFEGTFKIEVSNKGNIKTFNSHHPDGDIVKGSLQGGYRIFRTKMKKKWKESDLQKIKDLNEKIVNFNAEIKKIRAEKLPKEKIAKLQLKRDNLIQNRKKINRKLNNKYAINLAILFHRITAELFLEKPKNKDEKFVIHKDFDKLNNAVENLSWASQKELNERQSKHPKTILRKLNKQFKDQIPQVKNSKLGEMEVLHIKKRLKRGDTLKKLAKQFQVSDMQIHRIKSGENWSHVKLIEEIKEKNEK